MAGNSNNDQMRIGVIGMGPVGAVLAAMLIEAGAYVIPCDIIPTKMDKIKKSGLRLKNVIKKDVAVSDVCYSIKELASFDLDLAVISVKTPSLKKVVAQLTEIDSEKLYIMCAQNGIDNEIEVARQFGDAKTLRMVVNYAGSMSDANTVHVSFFNPPNYIASLSPQGIGVAEKLVELLNSVQMETAIPEDIQDYVWEKAILNAALSAVCAITRKTMKDVMDFPFTLDLVAAIVDESVLVAEKEGIELGKKFRRFCIQYLKNAGHHRPSMLIDLENGARTEIDQLNGKLVEYGRKHCQPTPLNQCVTALVHLLEYSVQ
jgi:2-dehydropantoate 2-reductase